MNTTLLILGVIVIVGLLVVSKSNNHTSTGTHDHSSTRDDGYSYLYYLDRNGEQRYEEDVCRGCIENRAEALRRKDYRVTEVVLGNKYSGDL